MAEEEANLKESSCFFFAWGHIELVTWSNGTANCLRTSYKLINFLKKNQVTGLQPKPPPNLISEPSLVLWRKYYLHCNDLHFAETKSVQRIGSCFATNKNRNPIFPTWSHVTPVQSPHCYCHSSFSFVEELCSVCVKLICIMLTNQKVLDDALLLVLNLVELRLTAVKSTCSIVQFR